MQYSNQHTLSLSLSHLPQGLIQEVLGAPTRTVNFNAAVYALLGTIFTVAGLSFLAAPAQTLAAVFGAGVGAGGAVGAGAALMWQMVGAGVCCVVAGAMFTLKVRWGFAGLLGLRGGTGGFVWLQPQPATRDLTTQTKPTRPTGPDIQEGAAFLDLKETKFKWLNFGLALGAAVHVVMLAPLAAGQGGPLAPLLLGVWGLTS